MPFILDLHPPYPTSTTYPKPCYLPTPTPDRTPNPPPPQFFFLNFHKNFTSPFTSTVFFSILRWFWVKFNPLHLHSPLFIILIIPNIVKKTFIYIYQCLLFLVYIPHTPHQPPTPNLATSPPQPLIGPPPPRNSFFEFSQKLHFSVHNHPDPSQPDTNP